MKKIIPVAALTVLSALLISGCAGAPAAPSPLDKLTAPSSNAKPAAPSTNAKPAAPSPGAKPDAAVPTPNAAQQASLMAELKKIDSSLDTPRSVEAARSECHLILAGSPEAAQIAVARHFFIGSKTPSGPPSDDAAKKIVAAVKANGFCKAAA